MGAIGDAYATPADLQARLGVGDDGTYEDRLDAASARVEAFCRRQFNKATAATARRFRPADPQRLPVDDFHTVTGLAVTVDGTSWDVTDVDPRPVGGFVGGQTGWPFSDLIAVDRYWPTWHRRPVVTVTAQWGWAAVPAAIKEATLDVAVAAYTASGAGSYPKASEKVLDYSVTYAVPQRDDSGDVPAELVKAVPYRRRVWGVA